MKFQKNFFVKSDALMPKQFKPFIPGFENVFKKSKFQSKFGPPTNMVGSDKYANASGKTIEGFNAQLAKWQNSHKCGWFLLIVPIHFQLLANLGLEEGFIDLSPSKTGFHSTGHHLIMWVSHQVTNWGNNFVSIWLTLRQVTKFETGLRSAVASVWIRVRPGLKWSRVHPIFCCRCQIKWDRFEEFTGNVAQGAGPPEERKWSFRRWAHSDMTVDGLNGIFEGRRWPTIKSPRSIIWWSPSASRNGYQPDCSNRSW